MPFQVLIGKLFLKRVCLDDRYSEATKSVRGETMFEDTLGGSQSKGCRCWFCIESVLEMRKRLLGWHKRGCWIAQKACWSYETDLHEKHLEMCCKYSLLEKYFEDDTWDHLASWPEQSTWTQSRHYWQTIYEKIIHKLLLLGLTPLCEQGLLQGCEPTVSLWAI